MTTSLCHPRGRRVLALLAMTAVGSGLLSLQPGPAFAAKACFSHPKSSAPLRLHLKTICHDNDASTVTYTIEAHEAFADRDVDITWGLDRKGAHRHDLLVAVEFDSSALVAKVEDSAENQIGHATVTRTGPNALSVSYARSFLEGATAYDYDVKAVTDGGNGEPGTGDTDVAPDSGTYHHQL
jgi:hypothetical protein